MAIGRGRGITIHVASVTKWIKSAPSGRKPGAINILLGTTQLVPVGTAAHRGPGRADY